MGFCSHLPSVSCDNCSNYARNLWSQTPMSSFDHVHFLTRRIEDLVRENEALRALLRRIRDGKSWGFVDIEQALESDDSREAS